VSRVDEIRARHEAMGISQCFADLREHEVVNQWTGDVVATCTPELDPDGVVTMFLAYAFRDVRLLLAQIDAAKKRIGELENPWVLFADAKPPADWKERLYQECDGAIWLGIWSHGGVDTGDNYIMESNFLAWADPPKSTADGKETERE